jgi:hypothetical protein
MKSVAKKLMVCLALYGGSSLLLAQEPQVQVYANWAPAKSSSNSSENARTSTRGLVRASYLKPGADITNWIKDRMAEEASLGVNKHFELTGDGMIRPDHYRDWDLQHPTSINYDLRHRYVTHDFTISGCKVSFFFTESYVGTYTSTSPFSGEWSSPSKSQGTLEDWRTEFDLRDIQPGLLSVSSAEDKWVHGSIPLFNQKYISGLRGWDLAKVIPLCANEGGCSITRLNFVSAGDGIKSTNLQQNTYSMVHSDWYAVSSSELAQRLVNAWRDAAKACGGKDLNKNLY